MCKMGESKVCHSAGACRYASSVGQGESAQDLWLDSGKYMDCGSRSDEEERLGAEVQLSVGVLT